MIITDKTKYREFLLVIEALNMTADELEHCFRKVKYRAIPEKWKVDYDTLIFGKLARLQSMQTGADFLLNSFEHVLLPNDHDPTTKKGKRQLYLLRKEVLKSNCGDALRWVGDLRENIIRITDMFDEIKYVPDAREQRAGIAKLSGGVSQLADWYALRMGISDIEQVYLIPWIRIYSALKIDTENNNFKRRLEKLIMEESKTNRK